MTEEQITMLRRLIKDEIECAQIDGFEHGQWGWAEKQLDEGWKEFQESFNVSDWWDKIFIEPTKGRSACIIDLVNSIIEWENK